MSAETETDTSLGYLFHHAAGILYRQSDQMLQEQLGIGMSQFKILILLQDSDTMQQRQIAGRLGQTEASISRQAKLLAGKGMLTTRINPKNRREHVTLPTPKGLKITQAAHDILTSFHAPVFALLNAKQKQQLSEMLRIMHGYVCQDGRPHSCDRAHLPPNF